MIFNTTTSHMMKIKTSAIAAFLSAVLLSSFAVQINAKAIDDVPIDDIPIDEEPPIVKPPKPPATISVPTYDSDGSFTVSWSHVASHMELYYRLQEKKNNGNWVSVYNGPSTQKYLTSKGGGQYIYRVMACIEMSCSNYRQSNVVQVTAPLSIPTAPAYVSVPSSTSSDRFVVKWGHSQDASYFELYEEFNGGGYHYLNETSSRQMTLSYRDFGLYRYKVRACNQERVCSDFKLSNSISVVKPAGYLDDVHVRTSEAAINNIFKALVDARAINVGDDDPDVVKYYVVNMDQANVDIHAGNSFTLTAKASLTSVVDLWLFNDDIEGNINIRITGRFDVIEKDGGFKLAMKVIKQNVDYNGDYEWVFNTVMILNAITMGGIVDLSIGEVILSDLDQELFSSTKPSITTTSDEVILGFELL